MIPHSKFEALYEKCGGVYKATVLIQKRLRELNRGARRLVEEAAPTPIETVMEEIRQGKIELVPDNDENRDLIKAEVERMTMHQPAEIDVGETTTEDELERRILSALSKEGS